MWNWGRGLYVLLCILSSSQNPSLLSLASSFTWTLTGLPHSSFSRNICWMIQLHFYTCLYTNISHWESTFLFGHCEQMASGVSPGGLYPGRVWCCHRRNTEKFLWKGNCSCKRGSCNQSQLRKSSCCLKRRWPQVLSQSPLHYSLRPRSGRVSDLGPRQGEGGEFIP